MNRKIAVITGSRAEYGLLQPTIRKIQDASDLSLQLYVTGMHLSEDYGNTFKEIVNDGFDIIKTEETLSKDNTQMGIAKSSAKTTEIFSELFNNDRPDIILILGDRFEIFGVAIAAMYLNIPIAHIHGGEITVGAVDNVIRHSITKMSHIHFTSTEAYRNRVIQMGEKPSHVFYVGAPGLETIETLTLLSKSELEKNLNITLKKTNLLVTYHPETLNSSENKKAVLNLLELIGSLENTFTIFTKANADADGNKINQLLEEYVKHKSNSAILVDSLGQQRYLSSLKIVDIVVGNSSSGIIEAAQFSTPTINIGNRQSGRIQAKSVINCSSDTLSIKNAFDIIYSKKFQSSLKEVRNPYYKRNCSQSILDVLRNVSLDKIILKNFHDIEFRDKNELV